MWQRIDTSGSSGMQKLHNSRWKENNNESLTHPTRIPDPPIGFSFEHVWKIIAWSYQPRLRTPPSPLEGKLNPCSWGLSITSAEYQHFYPINPLPQIKNALTDRAGSMDEVGAESSTYSSYHPSFLHLHDWDNRSSVSSFLLRSFLYRTWTWGIGHHQRPVILRKTKRGLASHHIIGLRKLRKAVVGPRNSMTGGTLSAKKWRYQWCWKRTENPW